MTTSLSRPIRAAAIALVFMCGVPIGARPAAVAAGAAAPQAAVSTLPERLTDEEFWSLVTDISEPDGYFRIVDNFTSNEPEVARIFTMLRDKGVAGGVYIGVGPEQNLTYIAAIRPAMAFVVDIRRQAVMQHLLFKAVFELAADRRISSRCCSRNRGPRTSTRPHRFSASGAPTGPYGPTANWPRTTLPASWTA